MILICIMPQRKPDKPFYRNLLIGVLWILGVVSLILGIWLALVDFSLHQS